MTDRQKFTIEILNEALDWVSPTDVGIAIGEEFGLYDAHSSTGSPVLKSLVKLGLVERNEKGHYRLLK